ncbi:MAG: decaprenyl-phosphate phosphoribosyltransferase [Bacteroidota bacterium]
MKELIKLIRIHQWLKNLFIFAPLFFSGNFLITEKLTGSFYAFIIFCLNASAVYIINDFKDIEKDKLHPTKKERPLASGRISKQLALVAFALLSGLSLSFAYILSTSFFCILLIYFCMNLIYSFGLKSISLIDVFIIAIGFVLRIIAGGAVCNIEISHWLYLMTFLLALFIALAKRRDDVLIEKMTNEKMRGSISGYNIEFINNSISMLCGVLIVSYILYITSPEIVTRFHTKYAFISVIFVIAGVLRYLQITLVEKNSGSPTKILIHDTFLKVTIISWITFFGFLIYYYVPFH